MGNELNYWHSVALDKEKCIGCTRCMRRCPTEAIRIREKTAHIIKERCIDCGECIRVCPQHAKEARTDAIDGIFAYPHRVALPAPTLYGQFKHLRDTNIVLNALLAMGFHYVYEVARGADVVTRAIEEKLKRPGCPRPLISSACPAIVRMIQIRFPELIDNLVDVISPMETAAIMAREEYKKATGAADADIGVFFITPCPAKLTAIRNPIGHEKSAIQGAISIMDMIGALSKRMKDLREGKELRVASPAGIGWANSGGEIAAVGVENALAVDGIDNVARVLEEVENNRLSRLEFFEGLACIGGCVGGPLTFENGYVAKNRMRKIMEYMKTRERPAAPLPDAAALPLSFDREILPRNVMRLDDDLKIAMRKRELMEDILTRLPGLDCGSCGSPTCRSLAEDIVRGFARELDCVILLKERVAELAHQMVVLADNVRN